MVHQLVSRLDKGVANGDLVARKLRGIPKRPMVRTVPATLMALLFLVLAPIVLVQAAIYYSWVQVRQDAEFQANLELARSAAATFDAFVGDILHQELAVGRALTAARPPSVEERTHILVESRVQYPLLRYYSWLNPEGKVVASSAAEVVGLDVRDREYFQAVLNGREWVASNLYVGRARGEVTFAVARGVRDDRGVLLGVVLASVNPQQLGEVLRIQRAQQGMVTVINAAREVVYHYPEVGAGSEASDRVRDDPSLARALAGEEVARSFLTAGNGQWMGARVPVAGVGWAVAADRPVAEALAPVFQDLLRDVGLLLFVAVVAVAGALVVGRRLTEPVARLRVHALAIGGGELERRVEPSGTVEMQELGEAFNRMAEEIKLRDEHKERLNADLARRASELAASNNELETFSYAVAHDLRSPLRSIDGFNRAVLEDCGDSLSEEGREYLDRSRLAAQRMAQLIDDLLWLSQLVRSDMRVEEVDLSAEAKLLVEEIRSREPERRVEFVIEPGLRATGDIHLLRIALEKLLDNAWKFTSHHPSARIEFGSIERDGKRVFFVRDDGAGFDMAYNGKLFAAFERLHGLWEFPGNGIGLAAVQRVVRRHGGQVWAEGAVERGATFYFTL